MTILDFLRKVASRWRIIVVCAVIGALLALATLPKPKHRSHVKPLWRASVVLGQSLKNTALTTPPGCASCVGQPSTTQQGGAEISHLAALSLNPAVPTKGLANLGGAYHGRKRPDVGFRPNFNSNDLICIAKDPNPAAAIAVAVAFSNALISTAVDQQIGSQRNEVFILTAQLQTIAGDVRAVREAASSPTTVPNASGAPNTTAAPAAPAKGSQKSKPSPPGVTTPSQLRSSAVQSANDITSAKLSALVKKYSDLYSQLQDVQTTNVLTPPVEILAILKPSLDPSVTRGQPHNISHKKWAAGGLGGGLLVGLLLALALALLDRSLVGDAALEDAFGLTILAVVPPLPQRKPHVVVVERPLSAGAEAYRRLRSALERMPATVLPLAGNQTVERWPGRDPDTGSRRTDGTLQAVALVGTAPRVGTTTSVANLAAALAEAGIAPLVIDTNLRRPALHRFLGGEPAPGVTDEVDGRGPVDRPSAVPGVRFLPAGSPVDNPSAYIRRAAAHLERWRARADVVVADVADLATVNDVADLGDEVDAVIVVGARRATTAKQAAQVRIRLGLLGAPVLGLVVVDVKRSWRDRFRRVAPAGPSKSRARPSAPASEPPQSEIPTSVFEEAIADPEPVASAVGSHFGSASAGDAGPTEPIELRDGSSGSGERHPDPAATLRGAAATSNGEAAGAKPTRGWAPWRRG